MSASDNSLHINWIAQDVGVINNFLSREECRQFIELSENKGFEDAPVTTHGGMVMMKDLRNNDRVMIDDVARAGALYERIRSFVPQRFREKWQPVGLNERLRLYRYDVGQKFDWHQDGYYERENGQRSFFTFMVYLNEGYLGGATSFKDDGHMLKSYSGVRAIPREGMALIFYHPIPHRGDEVLEGRKYVLRSDIMYERSNSPQS